MGWGTTIARLSEFLWDLRKGDQLNVLSWFENFSWNIVLKDHAAEEVIQGKRWCKNLIDVVPDHFLKRLKKTFFVCSCSSQIFRHNIFYVTHTYILVRFLSIMNICASQKKSCWITEVQNSDQNRTFIDIMHAPKIDFLISHFAKVALACTFSPQFPYLSIIVPSHSKKGGYWFRRQR